MSKSISCFSCKSTDTQNYLKVDETYSLIKCNNCELIFTYPHPPQSTITNVNEEKYDSHSEKDSRLANFDHEYTRAKKHIIELKKFQSSGKFLDVGCSYGIGMKAACDLGFEVFGIEPTKNGWEYAVKKLKLNVKNTTLEKAKLPKESFDVVTLYDVLEHVPDLQIFLHEIYRILKPGGLLVIQSPNIESFAARVLKTKWNWLLVPNHLWHFSYKSLTFVLEKSAFSVVWKTSEDNVFDFASNLKSNINIPLLRRGFVFKVIRQFMYFVIYGLILFGTKFWSKIGKGGSLRFYARKV